MMLPGNAVPQASDDGKNGNSRRSCPWYGCKRVYTDAETLESHIHDHEARLPAESVPGKVLMCSTTGCSGSFPNMQKLMEHMRHHHKPNIYFLCESCRAKLRSYRGLLTHLHTCSKVPRGKTKAGEPTPVQPSPVAKSTSSPTAADHDAPQQDSASTSLQFSPQIQTTESTPPAGVNQLNMAAAPPVNPPALSNPEPSSAQPSLQQQTEAASQSQSQLQLHLQAEVTKPPSSVSPDAQTVTADPPESVGQHQPQPVPAQPVKPAPGLSPLSPPGSTAVWRKNQGDRLLTPKHHCSRLTQFMIITSFFAAPELNG
ncbi:zinc finger protein 414 isoform X2 [Myripristis murdjan]|uniref:zinc finger protein 414 isoform X2 n=1 Tax=Myripristis murdjan TaxID=586833 RepID=UPI001175D236|nr:zinc finger protein 414 isoform X2 [Myripristis murdjan]